MTNNKFDIVIVTIMTQFNLFPQNMTQIVYSPVKKKYI
jgi:hypothetical protein